MGVGNILDRAILTFAPERGRARIKARVQAQALMNFDAASRGRRLKGWKAPSTDADGASFAGRARMRQLSRDMCRNAPFAARAKTVIKGNVVGKGIIPSAVCNKSQKSQVERRVIGHLNSTDLDFYGERNLTAMQRTVIDAVFESGEILALRRTSTRSDGLDIPLQIQLVETDHLDPTILSHGSNEVRDGIEYDAKERIVAYHIYEQHPGAISTKASRLVSQRWPASEVIFVRRLDRAGQTRSWPWLAPVMVPIGEMRDYQEAQILKQKMSAMLAGIATVPEGETPPENSGLDTLSPGGIAYTSGGETVAWIDPPRVDDYDTVMRHGLLAIAMGLGITYESLAGDLSRVNFSSARVGRLEMNRNVETWQQELMIDQFCKGVERWVMDAFRLVAKSNSRSPICLEWTPQALAIVDPGKELKPMIEEIDAGLTSRQRTIRRLGRDPDVIAREREEDAAADAKSPAATSPETNTQNKEEAES